MPRIRSLKPDFFHDEDLAELPLEDRLTFQGLWLYADREGRLEDRPKYLKAQLWPYEAQDIEAILNRLNGDNTVNKPFIHRYVVNGSPYIQVLHFIKHQKPHHTEKNSVIPSPSGGEPLSNRDAPEGKEGSCFGKGTSRKGSVKDPDSESGISEPIHEEKNQEPLPVKVESEDLKAWLSRLWLDATGKTPNNVQSKALLVALQSVSREALEAAILETGKAAPRNPLNYLLAIVERVKSDEATASDVQPDNFKADRRADEEAAELAAAAWQEIEALPESGRKEIRAQAVLELKADFQPEFILEPLIQARMVELFRDPPEPDPGGKDPW